ncbi:hypothetical protein GGR57DRAFT_498341 [Xylariaceae sp. FL1272]|nr:hypothetical protein GGR57DRAFT_498341 [Xylariaceae sp. FL1272]
MSPSCLPRILPSNLNLPLYSVIPLAIGTFTLARAAWSVLRFLQFHFLHFASSSALPQYRGDLQQHSPRRSYALITGSAAGIGFGFARELVRAGYGVVIHGRSAAKLQAAEADLRAIDPDADVRHLVFDASNFKVADLEAALAQLEDLPITVLINNVGGGTITGDDHMRGLLTYSARDVDMCLDMNARFMAHVTRCLLPSLLRAPRALVLNLTSGTREGVPWLATYSGSKAFVTKFSYALTREMRAERRPVDVLLVVPGEVQSQYNSKSFPAGTPTADVYARAVLDKVGMATRWGRLEMTPFWGHDLLFRIVALIPEWLLQRLLEARIGEHKMPAVKKA